MGREVLKDMAEWLVKRDEPPRGTWDVILWWEARRIPFNILLAIYGVVCLVAFLWAITTSGHLRPGEDAVEPVALLGAPVAINVLYTLGWLVEALGRLVKRDLPPQVGPLLLKCGLGLSLFLITLPAALWLGYRVLQVVGVTR